MLLASTFLTPSLTDTISLMIPPMSLDDDLKTTLKNVSRQVQQDRRIPGVRAALAMAEQERWDHKMYSRLTPSDPQNGLYSYLSLLTILRSANTPAATNPATTNSVASTTQPTRVLDWDHWHGLLRDLRVTDSVRLYLSLQQRKALEAFQEIGWDPRRAYLFGAELGNAEPALREFHRPVLRELVRRMRHLASEQEQAGRADHARQTRLGIVRLLSQVVEESPTPEVALLAADLLPPVLHDLNEPEAAEAALAFRAAWHSATEAIDENNIIPMTHNVSLAPRQEANLLASTIAVALVAEWILPLLVLAFISVVLSILSRGQARHVLEWRSGRFSGLVGALLVIALPVVLVLYLFGGGVSYTWLISIKSMPVLVLFPVVAIAVALIATRLTVRLATRDKPLEHQSTGLALTVVAGVLLLIGVVVALGLPFPTGEWRPPSDVQIIRRAGMFLGLASAGVILAWSVLSLVGRLRGGPSLAQRGRAVGAITARALLPLSVLLFVLLLLHVRFDTLHAQAFEEAALDPVAVRLGEEAIFRHFGPAADVAATWR